MKRRVCAILLLTAFVATPLLAAVADAADIGSVAVSTVNAVDKNDVVVRTLVDDSSTATNHKFTVIENGDSRPINKVDPVSSIVQAGNVQRHTVIVVDSSIVMARGDRFTKEKAAVDAYIDSIPTSDNELVNVIGAGADVAKFGGFTQSKTELKSRVDSLGLTSGRALNGAMNLGLDQLRDVDGDLKTMVVFASGSGSDATVSPAQIQGRIAALNIDMYIAGIQVDSTSDPSGLKSLIQSGRGAYRAAAGVNDIAALATSIAKATNDQYYVHYKSNAKDVMQIEVHSGSKGTSVTTNLGAISAGGDLHAQFTKTQTWTSHIPKFSPVVWRIVITSFALIGAGLMAWVIMQVVDRTGSLQAALSPYLDKKIDPDEDSELHMDTALMKRAIQVTEDLARERGLLNKIEDKLYAADMSINAAEFLFLTVAVSIIVSIGAFAYMGIMGAVIAAVLGLFGVPAFLNFKVAKRKRAFEMQLPDALQLLSGALRAGYSLMQGLDTTADQVDDPLGKELRQVMAEARLGRPLEDALADMANRVQSPDFEWTVMAIRIQREVGGNLSEVLDNVGKTMIERERLRREVNALTAEGKLSAYILSGLPPGLALYLYVTNPDYLKILFTDSLGRMVLGTGIVMMLGGMFWMKKMLKLDL